MKKSSVLTGMKTDIWAALTELPTILSERMEALIRSQ